MINTHKKRCSWAQKEIFHPYHDEEWGRPVHDDRLLFEMLCLEGAQAGLSWETILRKRKNYQEAFAYFDLETVANYEQEYITGLLNNPGIIRNRLKTHAIVSNAQKALELQKEQGSLNNYFWGFVSGEPIINEIKTYGDIPSSTSLSDMIAKDLKKRGFKFVGTTIIYAFLQAVGIVNDHEISCHWRHTA